METLTRLSLKLACPTTPQMRHCLAKVAAVARVSKTFTQSYTRPISDTVALRNLILTGV
jgi:hypothetical protein